MSRIPLLLFLIVFMTGFLLVPEIGPAWDEPDNIYSGGQYVNFFSRGVFSSSIFNNTIYTQESALARYPPIPNYVGTAIALLSGADTSHTIIVAFHVATVLFFALLVVVVYKFGLLLGISHGASLFAASITFLHPTLFGHGLSNLKDTAQVSLFTLALYVLVRKKFIAGGLSWGVALATKFNAIYVPIIWALGTMHKKKLLIILPIGLITAFVVWPYIWFDPIGHTVEVIRYFTTVGQGYKLFWNGVLYEVGTGGMLWWYPWTNILLTTPLPLLVLEFIGFLWVVHNKNQRILAVWFVFPLLRAFLPTAAFYDGMRHFMEILPAGSLIAAIGLQKIGATTIHRHIVSPLILIHLLFINITYFPYSTGYLNVIARDPNVRFDRDIEALSIKEAISRVHNTFDSMTLWSPIGGHLSWYYLNTDDRYVYSSSEADTIILVNKSSHIRKNEFEPLIADQFTLFSEVRRGDAVFAWIYRKK